jgi:hypothetical protein
VRRFLRKEALILAVIAFASFLFADLSGLSWRNVVIDWSLETAGLVIIYFVMTRVLRWNVLAYLTWLWIELNADAISNFRRFAFSHSPEFFWPSIEQMAVLVLPIAVALVWAFVKKGEPRAEDPASHEAA